MAFIERLARGLVVAAAVVCGGVAQASVTPWQLDLAEAVAGDEALSAHYQATGYAPLWVNGDKMSRERIVALERLIRAAESHGVPSGRYEDPRKLLALVSDAPSRAQAEALLSKLYLAVARDMNDGLLKPNKVVPLIKRWPEEQSAHALLGALAEGAPDAAMRAAMPDSASYARLVRARLDLHEALDAVPGPRIGAEILRPGSTGPVVAQLRARLAEMGYLSEDSGAELYDDALTEAVRAFQREQRLGTDGVAGPGTLGALNGAAPWRARAIEVALERERWLPRDRGQRHVWVNLTDFDTRLIDNGRVVFRTRSIIGDPENRTPEFSDEMEYIEVNPYWNVPRSITVNEYLPKMLKNPGAYGHLEVLSGNKVIPRDQINFSQYATPQEFPYRLRQPPAPRNALGLVKYMFPNRWNIYLHDTPNKGLFSETNRAFSHGCIRLNDPFDFGTAILAQQAANPRARLIGARDSGENTVIQLTPHVPVHLVYNTGLVEADGTLSYRRDVYGRDGRIWRALEREGVALPGAGG